MDWNTIFTSLITAVTAAGGIGGLLHWRQNKKAKEIENDKKASEAWQIFADRAEAKAEAIGKKLDEAYITIFKLRNDLADSREALIRSELLTCKKRACVDRDPPLGSDADTLNEKTTKK